jgi:hypothetical protein
LDLRWELDFKYSDKEERRKIIDDRLLTLKDITSNATGINYQLSFINCQLFRKFAIRTNSKNYVAKQ